MARLPAAGALLWLALLVAPASAQEQPAGGTPPAEEKPADAEGKIELAPVEIEKPRKDVGIEELRVTAQRREQTLEEIPVAVTAFSMEDLTAQGTSDIRGLANFTPNLEIKTVFAASNPTLFIRGVGLKDYFANSSSAVAVYNDDVYMNSPTGQLFQLFDLAHVEVLRGPQGSLYGRNASAGVIRAIARQPSGDFGTYASASYGSYNLLEIEGALEFPILEETLSFRGAYRINRRDGVMLNRCGVDPLGVNCTSSPLIPEGVKKHVNDVDNWAGRGIFRWTPTPDLNATFYLSGGYNRSLATQQQKIGTKPNTNPTPGGVDRLGYRDPDTCTGGTDPADLPRGSEGFCVRRNLFATTPGKPNPLGGDPYEGDFDLTGDEDVDVLLSSVKLEYTLGDLLLTSVTGYAWNKRDTVSNSDSSPLWDIHTQWLNEAWQVSQELRAGWAAREDLFVTSGVFFLTEDLTADNFFSVSNGTGGTQQLIDQTTFTWSAFGHASWALAEDITLEAGLRYNWDNKDFSVDTNACVVSPVPGQPCVLRPGIPRENQSFLTQGLSGDLSLSYQMLDDLSVYAKYSRGWKAGQFNGAAGLGEVPPPGFDVVSSVDPESVDAFEIGLKSNFFDRRVVLGAAAFLYRYNDLQVFILDNSVAALPTPRLVNANDAQVWGLEADLNLRPIEWLEIGANLGFLQSEYLDFTDTVNTIDTSMGIELVKVVVDYSGNRLINSPVFSASGYAMLEIPLAGMGWLSPRLDYSYKTRTYFDPNEGRGQFGFFPKNTLSQKPLLLLNARLSYRTPDDRIELAAFVRNLTDEAYTVDGFDLSAGFQTLNFVIGEPRIIGGSLTYRF